LVNANDEEGGYTKNSQVSPIAAPLNTIRDGLDSTGFRHESSLREDKPVLARALAAT